MHVEGHLAAALQLLLLGVALVVPALRHALGEQLLDAAAGVELAEAAVGLGDEAGAEGAEAELGHGAVEEDLRGDVHVLHAVLHVRHEQQVARRVEVVEDGAVEYVAQHCARLAPLVAEAVNGGVQRLDQRRQVRRHHVRQRDHHVHLDGGGLLLLHLVLGALLLVGDLVREGGLLRVRLVLRRLLLGRRRRVQLLLHGQLHHRVVHLRALVVHVLQTAQRHLGDRDGVALLLEVVGDEVRQHQEDGLVLEAVDVVLRVRINALQRLEQLVVQALQERQQVAPHLLGRVGVHGGALRLTLLLALLALGVGVVLLVHDDVGVFVEDDEQLQ
mmetsp:Transcript_27411/g.59899  ORF Transcript_27411/g.59899 Transcript_27411/m.59899 type:complete len:330 (+) Transcript_27411:698-1687(+)